MAAVIDVANYFLNKVDRAAGHSITQLKLYKLVYYAQAWSLVFRRKPLFCGEIQAWEHGPVPVDLYPVFQGYRRNPIPEPSLNFDAKEVIEVEEMIVLELVWRSYGNLTPARLRELTHSERPWRQARKGLSDSARCQEPISNQDIMAYYSDFVLEQGLFDIPTVAISLTKDSCVENIKSQVRVDLSKDEQLVELARQACSVINSRSQDASDSKQWLHTLSRETASFND